MSRKCRPAPAGCRARSARDCPSRCGSLAAPSAPPPAPPPPRQMHPGARHVWRHALEQRTRPTVHQVLQHLVKSCGGSAEPPPEHQSGGWPACTPAAHQLRWVVQLSDWSISHSLSSHWSKSLSWLPIGPIPADIIVISSFIVGVRWLSLSSRIR